MRPARRAPPPRLMPELARQRRLIARFRAAAPAWTVSRVAEALGLEWQTAHDELSEAAAMPPERLAALERLLPS